MIVEEPQNLERVFLPALCLGIARPQSSDEESKPQTAHCRDDVRLLIDEPPDHLGELERIVGQERRSCREVVPPGLIAAGSSVSVSPSKMSIGTRSYEGPRPEWAGLPGGGGVQPRSCAVPRRVPST